MAARLIAAALLYRASSSISRYLPRGRFDADSPCVRGRFARVLPCGRARFLGVTIILAFILKNQ